jgi:hypothetical protein
MALFDDGHALLIGVGGKDFGETVEDAKALHALLVDQERAGYDPDNVDLRCTTRADRTGILEGLKALKDRCAKQAGSTAIVYFSGHGGPQTDADAFTRYYLQPWGYDSENRSETAIDGKELTEALEQISAKRLLVFLDCCHAAGVLKDSRPVPEELLEMLQRGTGRVLIASCQAGEKSHILKGDTNSVFTQSLLQVLQGKGVGFHDGYARILDVIKHLLDDVQRRTQGQQHAYVNRIVGLSENFAICAAPLAAGMTKAQPGEAVHEELTNPLLAKEASLKRALLRLDFQPQVQTFYGLVEKKLGLALIHGPPEHGQRWLAHRLVTTTVDGGFEQIRHDCRQRSMTLDSENIWRRLHSKTNGGADRPSIAKGIRARATKRPTALVFHNVEAEDFPMLVEEVWNPLHEAQPASAAGDFPFVMLLLSEDDAVERVRPWAKDVDDGWSHPMPLGLPRLALLDANVLGGWFSSCIDELPSEMRKKNLVAEAQRMITVAQGRPQLVLQAVCELWDLSWFDLEEKWKTH